MRPRPLALRARIACLLVVAMMLSASVPALAQPGTGGEVMVADVTVRYGGAWVYDDASSVPAERIYLDAADPSLPRFYGLLVEQNPGIDAPTARDGFVEAYLDAIGATNIQLAGAGASSSGTAWSVHGAALDGAPVAVVVYADVATIAGQVHVHMIFTAPDDLHPALAEARASIQVNGVPAFRDLDPATGPAPDAGASLPDTFVGIWTGTGTETDPPATWPVTITFRGGGVGQVVGTATYPTLACGGDLTLDRVDPAAGRIEVSEDITTGEANCTDGGTMTFVALGGSEQMSFSWRGPGGTGTAEGVLEPVQASSQTVGLSTVAFSLDWEADTTNADPASLFLTHLLMPDTHFLYTEISDPAVTDTTAALADFEQGFFNGFGDGDHAIVAQGTLASGVGWRLYAVSREGVPYGLLVTADITAQPGKVAVSVLVAPVDAVGLAAQIVQDTIGIVDRGSPLTGIVPAELDASLSG